MLSDQKYSHIEVSLNPHLKSTIPHIPMLILYLVPVLYAKVFESVQHLQHFAFAQGTFDMLSVNSEVKYQGNYFVLPLHGFFHFFLLGYDVGDK